MNKTFWQRLDDLLQNHEIIIDRPKGSGHPQYPKIIYPVDYGYLKGVQGGDGSDLDVWIGQKTKETHKRFKML
ncbi:inorganic pyrophosphatase, partial [Candidatus Dependentiae bacterium]